MGNPNFYAILPADVRYDKRLKPMEKILYSEITSLTNKEGYCYATNSYFAELYEVHKNTVGTWINNLVKAGYLKSVIIYEKGTKNIKERRLYITTPINENVDTYQQKDLDPINEKIDTPINENVEDNNKYINNKYNNIYIFIDNEEIKKKFEYFLEQRRIDLGGVSEYQIEIWQKQLFELSNGDEDTALKILENTILGNWKKFFPLKQEKKSYSNKKTEQRKKQLVTEESLRKFLGGIE